jgi:hypothetical protein
MRVIRNMKTEGEPDVGFWLSDQAFVVIMRSSPEPGKNVCDRLLDFLYRHAFKVVPLAACGNLLFRRGVGDHGNASGLHQSGEQSHRVGMVDGR